jgi:hypothetical protein
MACAAVTPQIPPPTIAILASPLFNVGLCRLSELIAPNRLVAIVATHGLLFANLFQDGIFTGGAMDSEGVLVFLLIEE